MEYNFKQFVSDVQKAVMGKLGDGYDAEVCQFPKNNGIAQLGMGIKRKPGGFVLAIQLEEYYGQMAGGMTLNGVANDIVKAVQSCKVSGLELEDVLDFGKVKGKIACKLINTRANRRLLEDLPHIHWMDLSVVFYILLRQMEDEQMTVLIHQDYADAWGMTAEELYCLARKNMERLLPVQIRKMSEVIDEMISDLLRDDADHKLTMRTDNFVLRPTMYVLTNSVGVAGACYMLPGMGVEELADRLGKDLVVLPSSIHEVLAMPYDESMNLADMSRIVKAINQVDVEEADRLSDHVYYFDRKEGMLMVSDCGEIQWKENVAK